MPEQFTYLGPEGIYPGLRDAANVPVGLVRPGDTREFGSAPDGLWLPSGSSGSAAWITVADPDPEPAPDPEPEPEPVLAAQAVPPASDAGEPGTTPEED